MFKIWMISLILVIAVLTTALHASAEQPVFKIHDSFKYSYTVAFSRSNYFCVIRAFFIVRVVNITPPLVVYNVGGYSGISLTGECGEFGLTREVVEKSLRDYTRVDRLDLNPSPAYIGFFANPSYTGEFTDSYSIPGGSSNIVVKYVNGVLTRYSERLGTPFFESVLEINLVSTNAYFNLYPRSLAMILAASTAAVVVIIVSLTRGLGRSRVFETIFLIPYSRLMR